MENVIQFEKGHINSQSLVKATVSFFWIFRSFDKVGLRIPATVRCFTLLTFSLHPKERKKGPQNGVFLYNFLELHGIFYDAI